MKKKIAIIMGIMVLVSGSIAVHASETGAGEVHTRDGLKSYGRIHFTNKTPDIASDDAIFSTNDLIHIADRIDVLAELAR